MAKFVGLWIENYGSFYGRHYIPLVDRGVVMVMGENLDNPTKSASNGAGKTTWSDAWDWCLYGENPRRDAAGAIVNDEAKKRCCVTVDWMDDNGHLIRVQRLRDYPKHGNGPRLWVDGVERTTLDASATQVEIEKLLGMDREVFHASIMFGQEDTFSFADATDGARKELLAKIIPELRVVDALAQKADALLVKARGLEQQEATALATAEGALHVLAQQDPAVGVAQWEQQRQERVAALQTRLAHGAAHMQQVAAELAAIPEDQLCTPPVPPEIPLPPEYAKLKQALDVAVQHVQACNSQLAVKRQLAQERLAAFRKLEALQVGACSQCGQPVTAEHLAKERQQAKSVFDAVCDEGTALKVTADQAVAMEHEIRQRLTALEEAREVARKQAVQEHTALVAQRAAGRQHVMHLRSTLTGMQQTQEILTKELHKASTEANPFSAVVHQWQQQVATAQQMAVAAQGRHAAAAKRVQLLEFWKVGFGAKGLKSFLLDGRVAEMTQAVNRWVGLLTGGVVWVEFSTQRTVGKGASRRLVEDFSIRVFSANPDGSVTERNYRSWSGGEKYRVSLGIDFGLARLVASRASCAYDALVVDELFQHSLDVTGKAAVAELVQELAKEKSTIFIIDHEPNFQHLFGTKMLVRKEKRRSSVVGQKFELGNHAAFPLPQEE